MCSLFHHCPLPPSLVSLSLSQVSPCVKQSFGAFKALISESYSGSRVAELARIMGGRHLCKLQVRMTLFPYHVYCVEEEHLFTLLSHFECKVSTIVESR